MVTENFSKEDMSYEADLKTKSEAEEILQAYSIEEYKDNSQSSDGDFIIETPFNSKEINIKSKTMSLDNIIKCIRSGYGMVIQTTIKDLRTTEVIGEILAYKYLI